MRLRNALRQRAHEVAFACALVCSWGVGGCSDDASASDSKTAAAATSQDSQPAAQGAGAKAGAGKATQKPAAAAETKPAAPKAVKTPQTPDIRQLELKDFDGDDSEVELFSAAITAWPCAAEAVKTGDMSVLSACSPMQTITHGFAVLDTQEKKAYLLKAETVYMFELERGFAGTMDVTGEIVGTRGGVPVIEPEEYSVTPRPKPGAFKGCL